MKTQFRDPHGILNSLQNLSNCPTLFVTLLEAAESFDLCMIRRSSLLNEEQKQLLVEFSTQPLSLRHQVRLFLHRQLGKKLPHMVDQLPLPTILHRYLMYEFSWNIATWSLSLITRTKICTLLVNVTINYNNFLLVCRKQKVFLYLYNISISWCMVFGMMVLMQRMSVRNLILFNFILCSKYYSYIPSIQKYYFNFIP